MHGRGAALVHGRVQRVRRVQRGCSARLQSVCCDNTARVQNCARRTGRVGAHLRALELLVRVVIGHGLGLWCADEQRRAEGRLHGVDEQRWHLVRAQRMRSVHTQCRCRRSMHSARSVHSACSVAGRRGGEDRRHLGQAALGLDEVPAVVAGERRPRARAQAEGLRERAEDHEASSEHPRRAALSLQVRSCNPRTASCTCTTGELRARECPP